MEITWSSGGQHDDAGDVRETSHGTGARAYRRNDDRRQACAKRDMTKFVHLVFIQ